MVRLMRDEDEALNPDELLKAVQKEENAKKLGHLKIFFGMSAGVGKTFSMLQAAQQVQQKGVNVVVGTINTHGRKETEALLEGIPIIPEKWIKYKDTVFEEMDLEAIISMKPDLVLVDELAHTNVPGAKHPKRWQDVIEILDAGIDVYTTLNVQHLESRKDLVESLTGIAIRETVPDLVLERASSIELIDIPPSELLQRLQEGKVYIGDQSRVAAAHFFKEENLTALREIALRFTAEKVDHDLHGILQGKGWKTRERLMVAISSSPTSEQLIRSTRRLAFELDAPWIAVYIDRGVTLSDQDQARLNRHFNLARELGAEVITSHDLDIAEALQRIAKQRDITRIIVGRPAAKKKHFWDIFHDRFIERLEDENKHVDIIILRQNELTTIYQRSIPTFIFESRWRSYGVSLAVMFVIAMISYILTPILGYKSVGYLFLLGILALSFFVGRGPIFLAAFLSALFWGIVLIPPFFSTTIHDTEDIFLVVIYFFVAAIMGAFTSRMREQDQFLHKREANIEKLYEIERDIANSPNLQYLRLNIASRLEKAFPGKFDILIKGADEQLIFDSQLSLLEAEKERAVAIWVYKNGKVGGWSTDTLPSAEGVYFPIKFSKSNVGVLVYHPSIQRSLSLEEMNFIQTVAQQLGMYLERYIFEERISKQDYARQIERLHDSILHSMNRSFYTPLENIIETNERIQNESHEPKIRQLSMEMAKNISRMKLTVDNIIGMSELESGFMHFEPKKNSVKDLINLCIREVKPYVNGHDIQLHLPTTIPLLPFDAKLLKLALNNLLINSMERSDPSKPIIITLEVFEKEFNLSVLDEGKGIPDGIKPLIFDKFYHSSGSTKGLGLGLTIVKSVTDIHQGRILVENREKQGAKFTLVLPIQLQL